MDNPDLQARVETWLHQTGYPLEMRATQIVRRELDPHDWIVLNNDTYFDPSSEMTREVDIIASFQTLLQNEPRIFLTLEILIECKATSTPWVILKNRLDNENEQRIIDFSGANGGFNEASPEIEIDQSGQPNEVLSAALIVQDSMRGRSPYRPSAGYSIVAAFRGSNEKKILPTRQLVNWPP